MPHIAPPSDENIPTECKSILEEFQREYRRPSHILRILSLNPDFLKVCWNSNRQLVAKAVNVKRWVKEVIHVITGTSQQAMYCAQGHSHTLLLQGLTEEQVQQVQMHSFDGFSEPERSIFTFAEKAASAPKSLEAEDYDRLRRLGLNDQTILEILAVVWHVTAMNMIVGALDVKRSSEQMSELK